MKIKLKITYINGVTKDVDALFPDFVSYERTWNKSVTKLDEELRLTDIGWLAWHVLFRTKEIVMPFDPDWIGTVEIIEVREEEGDIPLVSTEP